MDVRCSFRPDSHLPRAEALMASAAQSVDSASLCWPALGPRQLPHPKSHSLPRGLTHLLMSHCQYKSWSSLLPMGMTLKSHPSLRASSWWSSSSARSLLPSPPPTPQALILEHSPVSILYENLSPPEPTSWETQPGTENDGQSQHWHMNLVWGSQSILLKCFLQPDSQGK